MDGRVSGRWGEIVSLEVLIWLGGTLSLGSAFWKDAEVQEDWCASSQEG